ncbi:MAG: DMT family transporter [Dermatophilus congolensis]|nr:DMT family transporter [Dermatophilus congolensis]
MTPLTRAFLVVFVFVGGLASAVQSRANGTLAVEMGVPIYAALWSFVSGWVVLTLGLVVPSVRRAMVRVHRAFRSGEIRWWEFLGGLVGGSFVGVQTFAVPIAGVALFLVAVVAGQSIGALVVERVGLGGAGPGALSWSRVGWASLAVAGAAFAMSGRIGTTGGDVRVVVIPVLLAVAVGALQAVQTSLNGHVRAVSRSFWVAGWANFMWGSGLLVGWAAVQAVSGSLGPVGDWSDSPWWTYLGGLMGITFIVAGAVAARPLGVLTVMLLMISGQLLGALALDLASPETRHLVTLSLVIGVTITLVAAAGSSLSSRRRLR